MWVQVPSLASDGAKLSGRCSALRRFMYFTVRSGTKDVQVLRRFVRFTVRSGTQDVQVLRRFVRFTVQSGT